MGERGGAQFGYLEFLRSGTSTELERARRKSRCAVAATVFWNCRLQVWAKDCKWLDFCGSGVPSGSPIHSETCVRCKSARVTQRNSARHEFTTNPSWQILRQ